MTHIVNETEKPFVLKQLKPVLCKRINDNEKMSMDI